MLQVDDTQNNIYLIYNTLKYLPLLLKILTKSFEEDY